MKSIQARFVVLMIAIVSIMLGIFGVLSYVDSKAEQQAELNNHLRAIEHRLSQSLPAVIWRFDHAQIRQIVDAELGAAAIAGIAVYDENQRLLYSAPVGAGFPAQQPSAMQVQEGEFLFAFYVSMTDSLGPQALGSVQVLASSHAIEQLLRKELGRLVLLILLLNLAIVAAMSTVMRLVIMRPLIGLRDGLQAMASAGADLTLRLPRSPWKEFAEVTDGFNAFAGQLEAALGASVDEVHQTISRIAQGDFSQPVVKRGATAAGANTVMAHLGVMQEALIALTAQLRQAKHAADAASQAKSDFLANMSHEIRTPLNAILGMTRLAMQSGLPQAQQVQLMKVMHSSQHLLALVNDILDFSKIEAGKLRLENTCFELADVLGKVTMLLDDKAADQGLEFVMDIAPDVPWQLEGDPLRLSQILVNFVSNAVKFTPQGQVLLYIRCVARERHTVRLRLGVRDTGIGIPASKQAALFESFVQTDTSNSRQYGGTGLGLAIAKRLAELMQGGVGVESVEGQGADFWCEVALSDCSVGPAAHKGPWPALSQVRALVVSAQPTTSAQLLRLLHEAGLHAESCSDWDRAAALLPSAEAAGSAWDWVLVDHVLAGVEGLQAMQRVNALELAHPPKVIWMPLGSAQALAFKARQHGCADVLAQPFHAASVAQLLLRQSGQDAPEAPVMEIGCGVGTEALRASAGARVLVVEDIEINREVAEGLLHELGIGLQVDFALNGQEAIAQLQRQTYHAVFMDMHMPVMDGLTATQAIRSQPQWAQMPIIAMTANHQQSDIQRCMQAGMCDFVTKPIDPAALRAAVQKWVVATAPVAPATLEAVGDTAAPAVSAWPQMDRPKPPQLLLWLQDVPGLDAATGLQNFAGRQATYREMLRRFVVATAAQAQALETALEAQDAALLQSLLQSLVDAATQIGAYAVAQQAQRMLDSLLLPTPWSALQHGLRQLQHAMQALDAAVCKALPQAFAAHSPSTDG